MRLFLGLFFSLLFFSSKAQVTNSGFIDSIGEGKIDDFSIGFYIDAYYGHFSDANFKSIPHFVSNTQNREVNINLALIDLSYKKDRVKARFRPGFGTYMNQNYSAEEGFAKYIVEASIAYKLSKDKEFWVEAGIIGSPFTYENPLSRDQLLYSRSMAAENVPYYLSGAKLTYPLKPNINFSLYLINGWQQIYDINNVPSLASQLEIKIGKHHLVNWNVYAGSEQSKFNPNYTNRYFSDIYWIYNSSKKWELSSCAFIGFQDKFHEKSSHLKNNNYWYQFNISAKYHVNNSFSFSARVEALDDVYGNLYGASPFSSGSLSAYGFSLGSNYILQKNLIWRTEIRALNGYFESMPSSFYLWGLNNLTFWF